MIPNIENAVKVNVAPSGKEWEEVGEKDGMKFYRRTTKSEEKKVTPAKPSSPTTGKINIKRSIGASTGQKRITPKAPKGTTETKIKEEFVYTVPPAKETPPPKETPAPIKAFVGENIFNPRGHAIGAVVNVSRDSRDAAREAGIVAGPGQNDIFVKYIPGTSKMDLNNVYVLPPGVFGKITAGTVAVQSQEGLDLLEKYKADPKTIENFSKRLTFTGHL